MSLEAGLRLGPYEIVAPVGAGGMGEVYRARDTRLDRTVAIKILPTSLAADPQLRERFDREARTIASLNHPHVCTLYDVGHQDGIDYLVLEYLEGETLADRLRGTAGDTARGLPLDEALRYATQILDALDRAHRSGIVHRDLKPANVMLTKSGAKLLDFGLAKTAAPVIATSGLSMAPTTPPNLTAQGTILGTFQYMAPEQIEGLEADARTDIFAFGAVLFEMLTGRTAFEGKTRAQLLGAILKDEPLPVSRLNAAIPTSLDRIVSTCLAKDPDDRWQTARDLLRELKWAASSHTSARANEPAVPSFQASGATRLAWGTAVGFALLALVAGIIVARHLRETPPVAEPVQFTIPAPENTQFGGPPGGGTGAATQLALSPDGRHVAFVARKDSTSSIWVRPASSLDVRQLPGTEEASFPFWSPDSRVVAFFAGGKLKKVQLTGGPPVVVCDAPGGRGGTWNRDGVIVFGSVSSALQRVPGAGGVAAPVSRLDESYGDISHRFPQFLPDQKHFLFTAVTGAAGAAPKPSVVRIGELDSADVKPLFSAESSVQFGDGHLFFLRDTTLMAQPFDAVGRVSTGDPFPIAERISTEGSRYGAFSMSRAGTLAYAQGVRQIASRLTWMDRSGRSLGQLGEPAAYMSVALSADERRVAVGIATGSPANVDVWTIDVARNISSRLTFDPAQENLPIWSPDGSQVLFLSQRLPTPGLHKKLAAGTGDDEIVLKGEGQVSILPAPDDWSRDGRFIVYEVGFGSNGTDLWVVPVTGENRKPFPLVQSPGNDTQAAFSPDGRWVAYSSVQEGVPQVFVQPFPPTGGRFQVSKANGTQPQWRGDGQEMYFLAIDGSLMATSIDTRQGFQAGIPTPLFASGAATGALSRRQYAVTKDGTRFLFIVPRSSDRNAASLPVTVIMNWLAAVQK